MCHPLALFFFFLISEQKNIYTVFFLKKIVKFKSLLEITNLDKPPHTYKRMYCSW